MDTTGFSQVGRYGTLSLLKRRSSTPTSNPPSSPNDLITSFGIDEAKLTFGSTSTCGVRLYYADVDPLHCQLVFEEGKAFLSVLGQGGVFVDGCWVYPHSSSSGGNSSTQEQKHQQTIIPLSNNSEFEIHQKRFRFTYPPKEIRKILLATPAPVHKRALRLSMIQSAQVFSPRPSKDPRENLRILQSPLKQGIFPPQTPRGGQTPTRTRAVSPLKYSSKSGAQSGDSDSDEDEKVDEKEHEEVEEEIVLVATNHPRVVEEESDLVILEDVPFGAVPSTAQVQAPTPVYGGHDAAAPPPRTPRRKSLGGTALHRAVLIRSAQRAVWRAEKEKEEEEEREEEMEVLGAVVHPVEVDEEEEDYDDEDHDVEMRSVSSEGEGSDEEQDAEALAQKAANKSLWRKSLERIIPWGFGASADEDNEREEIRDDDDDERIHDEEEDEEPAPLPVRPAQTPIRRVLGSFMTPQAQNPSRQATIQPAKSVFPLTERTQAPVAPPGLPEPASAIGPGRYSLGGGEARRVPVPQPWRVKDLVVPPPASSTLPPSRPGASSMAPPATPSRDTAGAPVRSTPAVTAEERRAIQERRRSAVREVREDTFWKDGAPGMSPAKTSTRMPLGGAPPSSSPTKPADATASAARRTVFASPTKGRTLGYAIAEEEGEASTAAPAEHTPEDDEDALDTRSLLDRMRETVEDMKRRRSMAAGTPRPEATPATLGRAAPTPAGAPTSVALASPPRAPGTTFALESVKKLDFSRISSPAVRTGPVQSVEDARVATNEEEVDEAEAAVHEEEPFSLLRHSGLEGTPSTSAYKLAPRSTRLADQKAHDSEVRGGEVDVRVVPLPAVMVNEADTAGEANEEEVLPIPKEVKAKTRGRSKLLRPPKTAAPEVVSDEEVVEEVEEASHSRVKAKATRSRTAKSPAPPPVDEPAPTPAPPVTRRQRSKTPQPPLEEEVEAHTTRSGRARRGTAEPDEPAPAPGKRGRKAHVEPPLQEQEQEQEQEPKKTPAAKRGRKPRAAPAVAEHEEEAVVDAPPAPAPAKRSRSRKAAAPEPAPQSQDGDELDSYDVDVDPSSSMKQGSIPVKAPPKGRKKAVAVKQEANGNEEPESTVPLATTRGVRTATAKTPAASKVAVPKTAPSKIAKPRSKLKTPGSAPAAAARTAAGSSTAAANAEKENTHETAGSGSAASEDAEDAPVKVRVSRRTGGAAAALDSAAKSAIPRSAPKTATRASAKSKVKVEDNQDQEEEVGKIRTTRVTRTRTKAG